MQLRSGCSVNLRLSKCHNMMNTITPKLLMQSGFQVLSRLIRQIAIGQSEAKSVAKRDLPRNAVNTGNVGMICCAGVRDGCTL